MHETLFILPAAVMILVHIFLNPEEKHRKRLFAAADSLAKDTRHMPACSHFSVHEEIYVSQGVLLLSEWQSVGVFNGWLAGSSFSTFSREGYGCQDISPEIRIYEIVSMRRL